MAVELTIVINATISLLLIGTLNLIGVIMIYKYFKHKNRSLLFMGLTWMGLSNSWLGSAITVFMVVFNENSQGLSPEWYIILSTALIPLITPLYVIAIADLALKKYKKPLFIIFIIYSVFYEVFMFTAIFTGNVHLMILKISPVEIETTPLTIVLLLVFMMEFLILGFAFCYKCFKTENPEIKLKGKILLFSYILFIIGNFLEEIQIIALQRILLIIAAIGFYIGYTLPNWARKLFLSNEMEH